MWVSKEASFPVCFKGVCGWEGESHVQPFCRACAFIHMHMYSSMYMHINCCLGWRGLKISQRNFSCDLLCSVLCLLSSLYFQNTRVTPNYLGILHNLSLLISQKLINCKIEKCREMLIVRRRLKTSQWVMKEQAKPCFMFNMPSQWTWNQHSNTSKSYTITHQFIKRLFHALYSFILRSWQFI